jgi:CHAT domain-containing protein
LLLLLLVQPCVFAQKGETVEDELDEALGRYDTQYEVLVASRGLELPDSAVRSMSRQRISQALENYPAQTALLFYAYKDGKLQMWLIDVAGIRASEQVKLERAALSSAIVDLRNSLGVRALQSARAPRLLEQEEPAGAASTRRLPLKESAGRLTTLLLPQPIAQQLTNVRHLIIVPALDIGTVPFALLRPFRDDSYLIDTLSISIAPSIYDVVSEIEKWQPQFQRSLVVGNPYFAKNPRWRVPSLPGALDEARSVSKAVGATPLTGREATKQVVLERAKDADFLYFATHGVASNSNPLSGGFLVLSADNFEGGWWTAREIQASELKARLAVLSACQTGLGQAQDAGVVGLARAFQLAGVPRVAMSLWSVDDRATAELMKLFIARLPENVPSEALRLAMLDMKSRQTDPAKWSSFVLFGTPR